MTILQCKGLSKSYQSTLILDEIDFELNEHEKVALIGDNGSGKSTLLKIITQLETPDEGQLFIQKNSRVAYLQQIHGRTNEKVIDILYGTFRDELAMQKRLHLMEENMARTSGEALQTLLNKYARLQEDYIQRDGYGIETRINQVLSGLKITHTASQDFDSCSGGEQTKIGLATLLLSQADILCLDEPTNHLDTESIEWLEDFIKRSPAALIIVSHDRLFLDRVITSIYELEYGQLTAYPGNYSSYVVARKLKLEHDLADFNQQQKEIKQMRDAIRRFRQWGNESDNPKFFKKAKTLEARLEKMDRLAQPEMVKKTMALQFSIKRRSSDQILEVIDLQKSYNDTPLFSSVTFELHRLASVALQGPNGSGKSTLLKCLLGEETFDDGLVEWGSQIDIGYLPQKIEFSQDKNTILETFLTECPMVEQRARTILAKFLFSNLDLFKRIKFLSGGELVRLKLAIIMQSACNVLILDEPTNHLDVTQREVIEDILEHYHATLIFVSHDRYFTQKLANQTLSLSKEGVIHRSTI